MRQHGADIVRNRTSTSTSCCNCRPTRFACRSRMPQYAGRRSCRPSCRLRGFIFQASASIRRNNSASPTCSSTIPGTRYRSTGRWATREPRAAPDVLGTVAVTSEHEPHAAHFYGTGKVSHLTATLQDCNMRMSTAGVSPWHRPKSCRRPFPRSCTRHRQ